MCTQRPRVSLSPATLHVSNAQVTIDPGLSRARAWLRTAFDRVEKEFVTHELYATVTSRVRAKGETANHLESYRVWCVEAFPIRA